MSLFDSSGDTCSSWNFNPPPGCGTATQCCVGPSYKISSLNTDYLGITFLSRKSAFYATGYSFICQNIVQILHHVKAVGKGAIFLGVRRPSYFVYTLHP